MEITDQFETFVGSKTFDGKGREIGFIVIFYKADGVQYAAVQKAKRTGTEYASFGAAQRAKKFDTIEQANRWAYRTAHERIAALA